MTDIKRGDRVRIRVDISGGEEYGSVLAKGLDKFDYITATVADIYSSGERITIEDIDESPPRIEAQRGIKKEAVEKIIPPCEECNSDVVYHDKKQEWLCPHCEL